MGLSFSHFPNPSHHGLLQYPLKGAHSIFALLPSILFSVSYSRSLLKMLIGIHPPPHPYTHIPAPPRNHSVMLPVLPFHSAPDTPTSLFSKAYSLHPKTCAYVVPPLGALIITWLRQFHSEAVSLTAFSPQPQSRSRSAILRATLFTFVSVCRFIWEIIYLNPSP